MPPSNEFKVDADGANAKGRKGPPRSRYNQRRGGKSKLIWIGVCLLLMVAGVEAPAMIKGVSSTGWPWRAMSITPTVMGRS